MYVSACVYVSIDDVNVSQVQLKDRSTLWVNWIILYIGMSERKKNNCDFITLYCSMIDHDSTELIYIISNYEFDLNSCQYV